MKELNPERSSVARNNKQDARYKCGTIGILIIACVLTLTAYGYAAGTSERENALGMLYVSGTMTESACSLNMVSAWQVIQLGNISTGKLKTVGAQGTPVQFNIRLQDCPQTENQLVSEKSGNRMWSLLQPAVALSVVAPADSHNPHLLQVTGAEGIGLRLKDASGRTLVPGVRGEALLLTPGENLLTLTLMAERTPAALRAGDYRALMNVGLSYE